MLFSVNNTTSDPNSNQKYKQTIYPKIDLHGK